MMKVSNNTRTHVYHVIKPSMMKVFDYMESPVLNVKKCCDFFCTLYFKLLSTDAVKSNSNTDDL